MKRTNKYAYIKVIQFKYENLPWEDACEYWTAEDKKNIRHDLKEYRMLGGGQYRVIHRRVPNE